MTTVTEKILGCDGRNGQYYQDKLARQEEYGFEKPHDGLRAPRKAAMLEMNKYKKKPNNKVKLTENDIKKIADIRKIKGLTVMQVLLDLEKQEGLRKGYYWLRDFLNGDSSWPPEDAKALEFFFGIDFECLK
jgi:hypothetical protein